MLTAQHKMLIDAANKSGSMHSTSAAKIISEDENSFWEFFANNNPAGIIGVYKQAGAKGMPTHPVVDNVYPILKNLLQQKNYGQLGIILGAVPYNPNVNNITTNASVWQNLGVAQGDYRGLFQKYYPNQYALMAVHSAVRPTNPRG